MKTVYVVMSVIIAGALAIGMTKNNLRADDSGRIGEEPTVEGTFRDYENFPVVTVMTESYSNPSQERMYQQKCEQEMMNSRNMLVRHGLNIVEMRGCKNDKMLVNDSHDASGLSAVNRFIGKIYFFDKK